MCCWLMSAAGQVHDPGWRCCLTIRPAFYIVLNTRMMAPESIAIQ